MDLLGVVVAEVGQSRLETAACGGIQLLPYSAFRIRNSWSAAWGDNGYGWLPYEYVLQGIAEDFWSLLEAEFQNVDLFTVKPAWAKPQLVKN